MLRGNTVMSGYLKDLRATKEALRGGWLWSGDLAVKHPENYIDRSEGPVERYNHLWGREHKYS
ncbi:unnamed protein product [Prunus armeniaca]|uniref:Uncharacterized protein n=1 Tax=Prunus armeniaca TaxID=36596 RepID=A0A6J5XWP3_PRUAR|nr:unnamed protein product [Prunus armeniaca]